MKGNIKNLILLLIIGVALIVAYFVFFKKEPETENLVAGSNNTIVPTNVSINTITTSSEIDNELSARILTTLSSIKTITLNDSIFSSLAFKSLIDGTVSLPAETNVGRSNPFAPIGVDVNGNATQITETTQVPVPNSTTNSTQPNTTNQTNTQPNNINNLNNN